MTALVSPTIWINLNGELMPAAGARISALDHGFLYGDSVYETARTHRRKPFLLGRHLDRLERSMESIFLALSTPRDELEGEVLRSIDEVPIPGEIVLRIVVSRGVGPLGLAIDLCREPIYLIYLIEMREGAVPDVAAPDGPDGGVKIVISGVVRNNPNALDPRIKSGNFLNNILAYRDARNTGAHEAILLSDDGFLAEGTTSNIFIVDGRVLRTPRPEGILDGITRAVILEEARAAGIAVDETDISPAALYGASEAFISSSVRGIVPVAAVGDQAIGSGRKGALTRQLQRRYAARMERECV